MNKTTIELNGKHYNALTGELVASASAGHVAASPKIQSVKSGGQVLDGVTRRKASATHRRHSPERSKTLMRSAVKKPVSHQPHNRQTEVSTSPLTSGHAPAGSHDQPQAQPGHHHSINTRRAQRAQTIHKSHLISRFTVNVPEVSKQTAPLPVRPAPAHTSRPAARHTPTVRPAASHTLISHALEHATAHQQAAPQRHNLHHRTKRRMGLGNRGMAVAVSSLAVLLLVGFFAYQNVPNMSMRIAARRAGFSAALPGYQPAGFAMEPIHYSPGKVTINFKSNSDDRAFQVTEQPSDWNSQALLDSVVAANGREYQTYQQKGKTLYVYDSGATWVSGGIWYQIEGDASLTGDQLLRIAASL